MNPITVIIGLIFCGYGTMVTKFRIQGREEKLKMLSSMRKVYGEKLGTIIHYLCYGIIPILFGIWILIAGVKGTEIFKVFK